jgi:hypothetical protein
MDNQDIVAGAESNPAVKAAATRAGVAPAEAGAILQGLLDHANAGAGVEGLVQQVADRSSVAPDKVRQFLPMVTGLLQGQPENGLQQGALGGLLAQLQSSPAAGLLGGLNLGQGAGLAEEAMGLVKGLFGGKPG